MPNRPVLFLLHAFGGSGRSWDRVVERVGDAAECVALDLPGFGENADVPALTVDETVEWVAARVRDREPDSWLVAGHSMGGRIAQLLVARAERCGLGLIPPAGLVLVSPSPLAPEPMTEERRALMRGWFDGGSISDADAAAYVDGNLDGAATPGVRERAIADVQRTNPVAWRAWLDRGSLEDHDAAVGALRTPAIVVVGDAEGDLGATTQRRLTMPHLAHGRLEVAEHAAHDVLDQRPEVVAAAIAERIREAPAPVLPPAFARLIASDRVSARTRAAMTARLDETVGGPRALTNTQRALLTAVLARVLPQRATHLDLAARIDVELGAGRGDGWRFAELPPDAEAWRRGLDTVARLAPRFADLAADAKEEVLDRIAAGEAGSDEPGLLTAAQMELWFQDVRAEAVRVWLSHPAAQAWARYDGFADGGDGPRKQGFQTTRAGEWEPWQRDWRTGEELTA